MCVAGDGCGVQLVYQWGVAQDAALGGHEDRLGELADVGLELGP